MALAVAPRVLGAGPGGREGLLYIAGEWRPAAGGAVAEIRSPATGEPVGRMAQGGPAEAEAAVAAAARAFPQWAATAAPERAALLRRVAALLLERREDLAQLITAEQGKPLAEARAEVGLTADYFLWNAEEARRIYGDVIPSSAAHKRLLAIRQPVGVAAAITPWNFPMAMLGRKLAPALAAGCTAVCKPAPETPLCAVAVFACLHEAGLPPGVANLVAGPAEPIGEVFLTDPRVRKISFTGSVAVGKFLLRRAADQLKKVSLELGGHAPLLVFASADLEAAVAGAVASKFRNAGQTCICADRMYVEAAVYDRVVERLVERVRALRVGRGEEPGVEVGPLIRAQAVDRLEAWVGEAVARGARVLCGGHRLPGPGHFFAPTVLVDVPPDCTLARQEVFGPVLAVWRVGSEAEAVRLANDTPYGLAAYVYTRDLAQAVRVSEALEYGIVGVNDPIPTVAQAPFGGVKESGIGREGGYEGLLGFLETKYVSLGIG
jgi:succinate-semialdehyde dehydrogenase/glutarate-semialdehyde dehydrogenase